MKTAFVVVQEQGLDNRWAVGLAHEGVKGYSSGYGDFKDGTTYDEASDFIDELNESHFGLSIKEAAKITCSSMF